MSKLKFQLIILIAILFVSVSSCLAASQTREVVGYGATRDAAIQNGIAQAVKMIRGVYVDTQSVDTQETIQIYDGSSAKTKIIDTGKSRHLEDSRGYVKYDILEAKREEDGWSVRLAVTVFTDERDGTKITLAVSKIKPLGGRDRKLEAAFIEELHHSLNQALMKNSDITILDRRSETSEIQMRELALAESTRVAPTEGRYRGQMKVANYLLFMSVQNFNIEYYRGEKNIITRKRTRLEDVKVHIIWEVVNAATRRISASGNSKTTLTGVSVNDRRDTSAVVRAAQKVAYDIQKQLSQRLKNL